MLCQRAKAVIVSFPAAGTACSLHPCLLFQLLRSVWPLCTPDRQDAPHCSSRAAQEAERLVFSHKRMGSTGVSNDVQGFKVRGLQAGEWGCYGRRVTAGWFVAGGVYFVVVKLQTAAQLEAAKEKN